MEKVLLGRWGSQTISRHFTDTYFLPIQDDFSHIQELKATRNTANRASKQGAAWQFAQQFAPAGHVGRAQSPSPRGNFKFSL